jgi:hypothetical protein
MQTPCAALQAANVADDAVLKVTVTITCVFLIVSTTDIKYPTKNFNE